MVQNNVNPLINFTIVIIIFIKYCDFFCNINQIFRKEYSTITIKTFTNLKTKQTEKKKEKQKQTHFMNSRCKLL